MVSNTVIGEEEYEKEIFKTMMPMYSIGSCRKKLAKSDGKNGMDKWIELIDDK